MNATLRIVLDLRTELNRIEQIHGKALEDIYKKIRPAESELNKLENLWEGSWTENYDLFRDPNNSNRTIILTENQIRENIEAKYNINFRQINEEIFLNIDAVRKFSQHLLVELTVIKNKDEFADENLILENVKKFQWFTSADTYVSQKKPDYDIYEVTIYDIATPSHICVTGEFVQLKTGSSYPRNFLSEVRKLLRRIEIKLITKMGDNSDTIPVSSDGILMNIFNNFHSFCKQLQRRHNNRSTIEVADEYDVQDLFHCILKLHFEDVREEEYTPSYGGSSTRMDFFLKNESTVIEIKKTRNRLSDKEIGEQLILDVSYYRGHPGCRSLKCFVYDPENRVQNPRGLEADLKKLSDDFMSVELIIRP